MCKKKSECTIRIDFIPILRRPSRAADKEENGRTKERRTLTGSFAILNAIFDREIRFFRGSKGSFL